MLRSYSLRAFRLVHLLDRRIKEILTPLGRWMAGAMLIAAVTGINTRLNLASQIFSLLLAMFFLGALVSWRFRPRLSLRRYLPAQATVGESCHYRVHLVNEGHRPLLGLVLHDELLARYPDLSAFRQHRDPLDRQRNLFDRWVGYPRWLGLVNARRSADTPAVPIPPLAPGQRLELSLALMPRRRGYLEFQGLRLSRADPLGLINGICRQTAPARLLVLPRRYPVSRLSLGASRCYQPSGTTPMARRGDAEEFVGLRPYRPGDSLRSVHWKSWARVGEPVVCEYRPEYLTRHALVLDTLAAPVNEATREAAVSVAASLAVGLVGADNLVELVFVGNRVYRLSSGPGQTDTLGLLRVLATVETLHELPFSALANQLLADDPPYSGCCLVLLARDQDRTELVKALQRRGKTVLALMVGEDTPAAFPTDDPSWRFLRTGHLAADLATLPRQVPP